MLRTVPMSSQPVDGCKKEIKRRWFDKLKFRSTFITASIPTADLDEHRFHQSRLVACALHRLRSRANNLNHSLHRRNMAETGECRHGCEDDETEDHVLRLCPEYEEKRNKLKTFFERERLTWDINTLLGLNFGLPNAIRRNITNRLAEFLHNTGLAKLI